jgi:hypothetical protein
MLARSVFYRYAKASEFFLTCRGFSVPGRGLRVGFLAPAPFIAKSRADATGMIHDRLTGLRTDAPVQECPLNEVGWVRTHLQNMTIAARAQAGRKTLGHLSQRVATRCQSLRPAKPFSVFWRSR